MADFAAECDLTSRVPAATGPAAAGILAAAQAAVLAYLNFDPRATRATEYYDGTGTFFLPLRRPTTAALIESVTEYDPWADADAEGTELEAGTDFVLRSPLVLERLGRTWPVRWERPPGRLAAGLETAKRAIAVDYTAAGDAALLALCKEATLTQAAALWLARPNGFGVQQSESVDGYAMSFAPLALGGNVAPLLLSPVAQVLLGPHRRRAIGGL